MADGTEPQLDGSIGEGMEEYLFYLVNQVHSRRVRELGGLFEALGLTIAHWRAMSAINRLDGCLMSELAEFTTVDRTTLTRTVDQLVEEGLAVRSQSEEDRRAVRVELTAKGRVVFGHAFTGLARHNARITSLLTAEDQKTLRSLLQKILKSQVQDQSQFRQLLTYSR